MYIKKTYKRNALERCSTVFSFNELSLYGVRIFQKSNEEEMTQYTVQHKEAQKHQIIKLIKLPKTVNFRVNNKLPQI